MESEYICEITIGKVSPTCSIVLLHHFPMDKIIKWSQEHLDTYVHSASIIIEQHDEKWDELFSFLGCTAVCSVGWESYGYDRCVVS
jgi:hypothetical protein